VREAYLVARSGDGRINGADRHSLSGVPEREDGGT